MNKPLNDFLNIFDDDLKFNNNYKNCLDDFINIL